MRALIRHQNKHHPWQGVLLLDSLMRDVNTTINAVFKSNILSINA